MRTADINESTKGAVPVPGKRSKVANNLKIIHYLYIYRSYPLSMN